MLYFPQLGTVLATLFLISLFSLAAVYLYVGGYRDEDGKLPAASTPEGKKVRYILLPPLALCVIAFIGIYNGIDTSTLLPLPLLGVIAIGVPLYNYLKTKKK